MLRPPSNTQTRKVPHPKAITSTQSLHAGARGPYYTSHQASSCQLSSGKIGLTPQTCQKQQNPVAAAAVNRYSAETLLLSDMLPPDHRSLSASPPAYNSTHFPRCVMTAEGITQLHHTSHGKHALTVLLFTNFRSSKELGTLVCKRTERTSALTPRKWFPAGSCCSSSAASLCKDPA